MKRMLAALGAVAATALLAVPAAATVAAQPAATVSLMHGIPGTPVDVVVNGAVVVPNFQPGTMQDISSFAGQTLTNVEVRPAGGGAAVIGPIASLARAGLRQLDRPGPPRRQREPDDHAVRERHLGHTGRAGSPDRPPRPPPHRPSTSCSPTAADPFTNLSNPNEAKANLPAGTITGAQIAPTGAAPIAPVPERRARRRVGARSSTPSAASTQGR